MTVQPGEEKASRHVMNVHKYFKEGCKENKDRIVGGQGTMNGKFFTLGYMSFHMFRTSEEKPEKRV